MPKAPLEGNQGPTKGEWLFIHRSLWILKVEKKKKNREGGIRKKKVTGQFTGAQIETTLKIETGLFCL